MPPHLLGQLVDYLVDQGPVIRDRQVYSDDDRLPRQRQRRFSGVTIIAMVKREAEATLVRGELLENVLDQQHENHLLAASDFRVLLA